MVKGGANVAKKYTSFLQHQLRQAPFIDNTRDNIACDGRVDFELNARVPKANNVSKRITNFIFTTLSNDFSTITREL